MGATTTLMFSSPVLPGGPKAASGSATVRLCLSTPARKASQRHGRSRRCCRKANQSMLEQEERATSGLYTTECCRGYHVTETGYMHGLVELHAIQTHHDRQDIPQVHSVHFCPMPQSMPSTYRQLYTGLTSPAPLAAVLTVQTAVQKKCMSSSSEYYLHGRSSCDCSQYTGNKV